MTEAVVRQSQRTRARRRRACRPAERPVQSRRRSAHLLHGARRLAARAADALNVGALGGARRVSIWMCKYIRIWVFS